MADVRVLMVLPAHEVLRESAPMAMSTSAKKLAKRPPGLPTSVDIDASFAAVPLGRTGFTARPELATALKAPQFVVRGVVAKSKVKSVMEDPRVFADPRIAPFPTTCIGAPAVGGADDVRRLVDVDALAALGMTGEGVAVAIVDTGINMAHLTGKLPGATLDGTFKWAPPGMPVTPGKYAVDHGTMCAFDALLAAPKATLIDIPLLQSTTPGGSSMEGFLSDAIQAYSVLMLKKAAADWAYRALVVNNSWGMYHLSWDFPAGHPGRYADNPNHPFNITVGTLARSGADILFAAGNCGKQCPDDRCQSVTTDTITGANAHPDVLTVAGVDTKRRRVGYSSQGPAIAGMKHAKPDIASYTHFEGSGAFPGEPDTGTSAACPVAAGCLAALRSKLGPDILAPHDLSREVRADARHPNGSQGWNRNLGYGILDAVGSARRLMPVA